VPVTLASGTLKTYCALIYPPHPVLRMPPVTDHEKARRQRQVLGDTKPRLKSRKEITQALHTASGDYAAALRWVPGDENTPV